MLENEWASIFGKSMNVLLAYSDLGIRKHTNIRHDTTLTLGLATYIILVPFFCVSDEQSDVKMDFFVCANFVQVFTVSRDHNQRSSHKYQRCNVPSVFR